MDTRADFQRLLEDMDKVIQSKRQELLELDERLESSRNQLSEREAEELRNSQVPEDGSQKISDSIMDADMFIREQQKLFDQQVSQLSDELNELEAINQELVSENGALKKELAQSKTSTEKLRAKMLLLSETLEEVKKANLELNIRLAHAETETNMQRKLLKKSSDQDEILLAAFNDKLESMRRTIESKDDEIRRLQSDNQFTLETLGITLDVNHNKPTRQAHKSMTRSVSVDSSHFASQNGGLIDSSVKQKIIEVAGALKEKDAQIELLKSQLLQATRDLESNANLLETFSKYQLDELKGNLNLHSAQGFKATETELVNKCEMLESELELKDKQAHLLEFRNRHFEVLLPKLIINLMNKLVQSELMNSEETIDYVDNLTKNLGSLLGEVSGTQRLLDNINQLKYDCNSKDVQIQRLVDELNRLDDAKYDEPDKSLRRGELKQQQQQQQLDKPQIDKISREPQHEQQQQQQPGRRITHSNELAKSIRPPVGSADGETSSSEKQQQVPDPQQSIKADFTLETKTEAAATGSEGSASIANQSASEKDENFGSVSRESERSIKEAAGGASKTKGAQLRTTPIGNRRSIFGRAKPTTGEQNAKTAPIDQYTLELHSRLRQLENENELLELAMKEILLSIKWSDAKCSTILIDCPSLERLCQLIEARFLTKSAYTPSDDDLGEQVVGSSDQGRRQVTLERTSSRRESYNLNKQSDLFQLVILKGELDLLRGQNEQLRADIKFQRDEYRTLLNNTSYCGGGTESAQLSMTTMATKNEDKETDKTTHQEGSIEICEVECQTETGDAQLVVAGGQQTKCNNCSKVTNLMRHLLQCIANIESRVNRSDETYANQLLSLYKLSLRLERELTICENFLSESRRQYHELRKQMMLTNSNRDPIQTRQSQLHGGNNQVYSTKMTITLLQSIIKCLQARIDYKDERLQQMESLLMEST